MPQHPRVRLYLVAGVLATIIGAIFIYRTASLDDAGAVAPAATSPTTHSTSPSSLAHTETQTSIANARAALSEGSTEVNSTALPTIYQQLFASPNFADVFLRAWVSNDPAWQSAAMRMRRMCAVIPREKALQALVPVSDDPAKKLTGSREREMQIDKALAQCAGIETQLDVKNEQALAARRQLLLMNLAAPSESDNAAIKNAVHEGRIEPLEVLAEKAGQLVLHDSASQYSEAQRVFAASAIGYLAPCELADICRENSPAAMEICYYYGACIGTVHDRLKSVHATAGIPYDLSLHSARRVADFFASPTAQTRAALAKPIELQR